MVDKIQNSKINQIWFRILLDRLDDYPLVKSVKIDKIKQRLILLHDFGIINKIQYGLRGKRKILTVEDSSFSYDLKLTEEYVGCHNLLKCDEFYSVSYLQSRLVIASMMINMFNNIDNIHHSDDFITRAWDKLKKYDTIPKNLHFLKCPFSMYPAICYSKVNRYLNVDSLRHAIWTMTFNVEPINTSRMIEEVYKRYVNKMNPITYASILRRLNIKTMLDLYPEGGIKAVACALAGIKYSTVENFDNVLNRGIIETTGLDYEPYDKSSSYDLLAADTLSIITKKSFEDYLPQCRKLFLFQDNNKINKNVPIKATMIKCSNKSLVII